jgi:hypothetical protein
MKKTKLILMFAVLFAISSLIFQSCDRCSGVVCLNDGTCDNSNGRCVCATGFEGADCGTEWRDKYIGIYKVKTSYTDTALGIVNLPEFTCEVTKHPTNSRVILISQLIFDIIGQPTFSVPAILKESEKFSVTSIDNQSGVFEPPFDTFTGQAIFNSSEYFTQNANSTTTPRFGMYYRTASSDLANIGLNAGFYPIP